MWNATLNIHILFTYLDSVLLVCFIGQIPVPYWFKHCHFTLFLFIHFLISVSLPLSSLPPQITLHFHDCPSYYFWFIFFHCSSFLLVFYLQIDWGFVDIFMELHRPVEARGILLYPSEAFWYFLNIVPKNLLSKLFQTMCIFPAYSLIKKVICTHKR